ncbi:MAG: hypothetical protein ACPGU4_13370, partial [Flavobacteriales bacterium]
HQISDRAERLGISFAKMLGMLISRGHNLQEPVPVDNSDEIVELESQVNTLESQLEYSQSYYRDAAAELISQIAETDDDQLQYIEYYNDILTNNPWNDGTE